MEHQRGILTNFKGFWVLLSKDFGEFGEMKGFLV